MFSLLRYFVIGLLVLVAGVVALKVIAGIFVIGIGLLIVGAPIALVGYGVAKLIRHRNPVPQISEEDRRWLES